MWDDLSLKQSKTLEFIIDYIKKNSFAPTYQEIAKNQRINIKSVAQRLEQLRKKGYIEIRKNIPRGIVLTQKSGFESSVTFHVNIYRSISKFKKYFKLDDFEKSVSISPYIFGIDCNDGEEVFMLRVTEVGSIDNYLDVHVNDGDIIVVFKGSNFPEDSKVLALYDNRLVLGSIAKIDKFFAIKTKKGVIPVGGSNALIVGRIISIIKNLI